MNDQVQDSRLVSERALFRRIIIAWQDLEDARASINLLLGLNRQRAVSPEDETVRAALITAVVVSYGRMFAPSRNSSGAIGHLPDRFQRQLTGEQRALHQRLLDLRNKEFAHSDNDVAKVEVFSGPNVSPASLMPVSHRLRRYSVSHDDLAAMDALLGQVHVFLFDELKRLYPLLAPHGGFYYNRRARS